MDFDFVTERITPTQLTVLTVAAVGALGLPSGTSAQRPGSPTAGFFRYNSDNTVVEYWNGSAWTSLGTGTGSVTSVAVAGSTGLGVSGSPITTSGTITLTLGAELQSLSALSTTGLVSRTGSATYSPRTITGTGSNISVTNGDGVSGNPTIDLVNAGTAVTNLFQKITTDAKGRVTATSAVSSGDITTSLGYTPINKAGDTMTSAANLTFSGGGEILGLPATPSGATAAASKAYVDSVAQGLDPKASVRAATVTAGTLATSFANGQSIDGVTLVTGDRILLKNQSTASENGIYTVNASGAPTRAIDMDLWSEVPNAFTFVEEGSTQADTAWVCTSNQGGTINSTAITFVQFAGAGSYTAGTGLTLTGTQFSITSPIATTIGGTGLTSIGSSNQILGVNNGGSGLEYKTVTAGTAISVAQAANSITINNTGVTSNVAGTGISVSGATGAVTITNTGVTSNVAGTGISVSGGTGAVTINNTGVLSLAGTSNQISASASTGAITLSVPSTFVAPGSVAVTTSLSTSISAGVTAAGSTQGTATALTTDYNVVTTVTSGTGVVLPTASSPFGRAVTVLNRGANPLSIYPPSGAAIDAGAANAPVVIQPGAELMVFSSSATQYYAQKPSIIAGSAVSVTQGNGIVTIANTGVASTAAGTGISVSGATGAVTITNTGVTSNVAGTGISVSGGTGAVTITNSGVTSIVAGTGVSISGATGAVTVNNTGVTSVALSLPSFLTVSGSPVTTSGTLTATLASQTANTVFAAPNGSAGAPTFRTLAQADLTFFQLYKENASAPTAPTAAGTNAVAIGSGASASAANAIGLGDGVNSRLAGGYNFAQGRFATAGDAQAGLYVLRNSTTNATVTELFLNGSSSRLALVDNSVFMFDILVCGRRTDATGGTAAYRFVGVMKRDSGAASTSLVGSVSKTVVGETNVAWDASVTPDTTNGSILVQVTGEAAKTIRWVAVANTVEVTN